MKILSNREYRRLTDKITALEEEIHRVQKTVRIEYDRGVAKGYNQKLTDARQQFVVKLRAVFLGLPFEGEDEQVDYEVGLGQLCGSAKVAELLRAYDVAPPNLYNHARPFNRPLPFPYTGDGLAASLGLGEVFGK